MRRCWTGRPFGAAARGTAAAPLAGVDLVSVRWLRNLALGVAAVTVAGCGGSVGRVGPPPAAWVVFRHLPGVVDLAGPRTDGSFLVAAAGRLLVLGRDGTLSPFARGAGGYLTATGTEPYLVLTSSDQVRGTRCSFGTDTAFAIEFENREAANNYPENPIHEKWSKAYLEIREASISPQLGNP